MTSSRVKSNSFVNCYKIRNLISRLLDQFCLLWGNLIIGFDLSLFKIMFFSCHFLNIVDLEYVLNTGLWNFRGSLIVLRKWELDCVFDDMEFDSVEMWFQARNLSASKMNATNASFIGAFVGEYLQYDVGVANWKLDFPIWRIRVRMLVNHKLITGFFMERINKLRVWIPFRYERLADFCYYCESLYHMESSLY